MIELRADRGAKIGIIFADAGREHERVGTVELEQKRADPVARRADKYVERELGARLVRLGGRFEV